MLWATVVQSATYPLPSDGSNVVGTPQTVVSRKGDNLSRLAMRYEMGYNEMVAANPTLSRKKRIPAGTTVLIPSVHTLPNVGRTGIVINLATMRLFYFSTDNTVVTFPVAIGKKGWQTPQGDTIIKAKHRHPTWTPPASIRREAARRGKRLRKVYPAGPNNPLGTRALRLDIPGYLIHGTNKPWTIGQRRSHGCIRMRKKNIEDLFEMVAVGTSVKIIHQPATVDLPQPTLQAPTGTVDNQEPIKELPKPPIPTFDADALHPLMT